MKAEIKHLGASYRFGRNVLTAQVVQEGTELFAGDLSACITYAREKGIEVTNALDVLHEVVFTRGHGA